METNKKYRTRVVIIGGGFGGINAAKALGNKENVEVTLIDRRNHHLFQPLLYQVAMAGLSPAEIAYPIRSMMSSYRNINVILTEATHFDFEKKIVFTTLHEYPYDYLVLACGSQYGYFGRNEWEEFAPGLKTLAQATEIRRRVLMAFELAANEVSFEAQKKHLTFIIIGGGPTGVELAGAIGEMSRHTLMKDFKNLDTSRTRIILLEGGARILPSYHESLSRQAARDLENLGVQVWTNSLVTEINENGVYVGQEFVKASTVLWAAGVVPSPLNQQLPFAKDKSGRIIVDLHCNIEKDKAIYVVGDQAAKLGKDNSYLPGLAPVALQQGAYVGKHILLRVNGKNFAKPFVYIDKGQMATIGRKRAVLQAFGWKQSGFLAWVAWLLVHIYYLIGFKNRFFVLCQWFLSYATYLKGARLIIAKEWRLYENHMKEQK